MGEFVQSWEENQAGQARTKWQPCTHSTAAQKTTCREAIKTRQWTRKEERLVLVTITAHFLHSTIFIQFGGMIPKLSNFIQIYPDYPNLSRSRFISRFIMKLSINAQGIIHQCMAAPS